MDADYGKGMTGPDHAQQIQELAQRLDRLLGKNAQARGRVEAMLGRLDLLERSDD